VLRYQSTQFLIDLPEASLEGDQLEDEITPFAELLQVVAQEIEDCLGPSNPLAVAAFPGYTFPQVVSTSKNPMLIASLDSQVLAAQMSLPLDQLLEMQTPYVNDYDQLLSPVSAETSAPLAWPVDQKSSSALFKFFKNPPTAFGEDSSVSGFLKQFGGLKTKYTEVSSLATKALSKLSDANSKQKVPSPNIEGAADISKMNMTANITTMQKMGMALKDSHLDGKSFGGFKL
jgi:hypothetical protein